MQKVEIQIRFVEDQKELKDYKFECSVIIVQLYTIGSQYLTWPPLTVSRFSTVWFVFFVYNYTFEVTKQAYINIKSILI